jgi:hypothetical protein
MTPYNRDMLGMGIVAIAGIFFLISIAINAFICYLLQECYKRIPPQFRKQQPNMVWLLLIPCFAIIWNFFVFPPLSKSFKAYFDSVNRTDVGDCQQSIGLAYAICSVASVIPYLGCVTGLAALVLLIIYLIKTNELKNQIPTETGF